MVTTFNHLTGSTTRGNVMARLVSLVCAALLLGGCALGAGYAGSHPGYIKCKGKGTITGTGQQSMTVIGGGAGQNSFSIQADCGDGFEYDQGEKLPVPAKP